METKDLSAHTVQPGIQIGSGTKRSKYDTAVQEPLSHVSLISWSGFHQQQMAAFTSLLLLPAPEHETEHSYEKSNVWFFCVSVRLFLKIA